MAKYLDIPSWSRRDLFEFFIDYSKPHFNICTQLDITNLLAYVKERAGLRISFALHYFSLRIANEVEPFRYRLKEDNKIFIYDVIDGGTTVLMPNESFAYAYFDYDRDFYRFVEGMSKAVEEVRTGDGRLRPTQRDDVIYHTSLPWISFTSFAHARTKSRGDSIPRIAFGKFTQEHDRMILPFSVEVHHALMDGLHVGRYLSQLEEALANPEGFISGGKGLAAD